MFRALRSRKVIVRTSLLVLPLLFWGLGKVKRNYWINSSPDGRFSTSIVRIEGWRKEPFGQEFLLYVTDHQTGESVLATRYPERCAFNPITLNKIEWDKSPRKLTAHWEIRRSGVHRQTFDIAVAPLRVKAEQPGCGADY